MELGNKLYNLYLKIIEKIEKKEQISDHNTCELREDGETYFISISKTLESIENGKEICTITFQDLKSPITLDKYNNIIKKINNKLDYFKKIEDERLKKQQEIIVDRLLNKFN
tara:strand:- start:15141 stop:15476 length:336 start_codon:yes stop_codon:yes gene_type:complete